MFIGTEIRLDVGFNTAQARLANLAHGGLLRRASQNAYKWGADQARVGPLGALGTSRLIRVQFRRLVSREDSAVWALRWEAVGTTGGLFPVLDADVRLIQAAEQATVLAVSGAYRPPMGAGLDRTIMHLVAESTIQTFTRQLGVGLMNRAAAPEAAYSASV